MINPFKNLTKKEWLLWICSLVITAISNIISGEISLLALITAWIGVTSLIFAAKGNVWSKILMIVFSILYGIISYEYRYWGEMVTYLGMTLPMAVWSTITWIRNPSESGTEVAIQRLTKKHAAGIVFFGSAVTAVFYFILSAIDTPNLALSTISIATSFLAAALTMLRSSYYALGYAANDIILIILWGLAAAENPVYFTVEVNFVIFFLNDMYGFISWKKRELIQN